MARPRVCMSCIDGRDTCTVSLGGYKMVPTEQNHSVYAGKLSVNLWHQCQNAFLTEHMD